MPSDPRQKRCKKNCGVKHKDKHKARAVRRDKHELHFIGVDGEGVTRPTGEHYYDMLSVGDKSIMSPDGGQLHYKEIFEFLYDCFLDNPNAVFVGFFLGYDFNQWFRTMPEGRAAMLLTPWGRGRRKRTVAEYLGPFPVDDGEWEFDILGMKRFKLRPMGAKSWMYINDAGAFFQTAFLNVINPKDWETPIVTAKEYRIVEEGKRNRGNRLTVEQQLRQRDETNEYNTLENEVLARVMGALNAGLVSAGIRLDRDQWYGPGQAAQAWMTLQGIPTNAELADVIPSWAWETAQYTYFGGWFEIFAHGHIEGVSHEYDINSAYPYAIAQLPCLLHGDWISSSTSDSTELPESRYLMVHARVSGSNAICGTMLHRSDKSRISRPHNTAGWYWMHELDAAIDAGLIDDCVIDDWVAYIPCDCNPPYQDIMPELYLRRLAVGKNTPEGKAYKLIYNSCYGKHAQSIGNPKFGNAVYASLITSACRTQILRAIASHPNGTGDLLMVATDGVYFRTEHPHLEISKSELGKWDHEEKHNLTLFMPGIYWDDTTRERMAKGESPKLKSRGISGSDLAKRIGELDKAFAVFKEWPRLEIPINFSMTSCTQALARNKWHQAGMVSSDDIRVITADPYTKRYPELHNDNGVFRSEVYGTGHQLESVPYDKTFGIGDSSEGFGLSPDGPLLTLAHEMILP